MKTKLLLIVLVHGLLAALWAATVMATPEGNVLTLTKAGESACKLMIITDTQSNPLLKRAADLIDDTIGLWSGIKSPSIILNEANRELPADQAIVFTTLDVLKKVNPGLVLSHQEMMEAASLDEHGFVFVPLNNKNVRQLFVVSQTPRGVYNGAVYLRDFCIDGDRQNLYAEFQPVIRSPQMAGRAAYTLSIWAQEAKYTSADWATIFESFARDGVDTIYFWVSGHFPSKQFPQSYKCKDFQNGKLYDSTVDSRIETTEDLKAVVDSAHGLGLKIYLGGGLGCWCGTQFLTNLEPDTIKVGQKEQSLCPSNPKSRNALIDYYQELFAALPEADGLFIESADEAGECKCDLCSKSVDALGSRQFGQSQLSLCQKIMSEVWRDHPQAHLAYTIGYQEHVNDVAYYSLIQRLSNDPRFEWMEARNSWSFPGPNGEARPASFFSKKFMHWNQDANVPLETIVGNANRAKAEGMCGLVTCFSPGFDTGVFYKDVPIPTDALPHVLTGFVYREATWNPNLTVDGMRDRTQRRFFGKDAPKNLAEDLWTLREILRSKQGMKQMGAIEQHIQEARPNASPKTLEGLRIMTHAVNDAHKYLPKKQPK